MKYWPIRTLKGKLPSPEWSSLPVIDFNPHFFWRNDKSRKVVLGIHLAGIVDFVPDAIDGSKRAFKIE